MLIEQNSTQNLAENNIFQDISETLTQIWIDSNYYWNIPKNSANVVKT